MGQRSPWASQGRTTARIRKRQCRWRAGLCEPEGTGCKPQRCPGRGGLGHRPFFSGATACSPVIEANAYVASLVSSSSSSLSLWYFHGLRKPWLYGAYYAFDILFFPQTLSYNKYNLRPQTSEKQAKEILIRRQNTLRESMRKGHSLPWGKPVRWDSR